MFMARPGTGLLPLSSQKPSDPPTEEEPFHTCCCCLLACLDCLVDGLLAAAAAAGVGIDAAAAAVTAALLAQDKLELALPQTEACARPISFWRARFSFFSRSCLSRSLAASSAWISAKDLDWEVAGDTPEAAVLAQFMPRF